METLLIGIAVSLFTEAITWLDKKLSGTTLKGDGAFILSAAIAFFAAAVQVAIAFPGPLSLSALGLYFAQVWAVSQVFFIGIYQMLGLDVSSPLPVVAVQ